MCELKFYSDEFTVDYAYYRTLMRRQRILGENLPRKTVVHNTMITTFGLKYNAYSTIFHSLVLLDDLFS